MHCGRGLLVHMVHLPPCVHATKSATAAFGPAVRVATASTASVTRAGSIAVLAATILATASADPVAVASAAARHTKVHARGRRPIPQAQEWQGVPVLPRSVCSVRGATQRDRQLASGLSWE